jgi:crotonobetainyl-CoA:carnitine CoA-transferase CaiB-like acyl-CoA transferase
VGSVLTSGCRIAFATGGLSGLAAGQALRSLGAPVTLLDSPAETAPASAPGQAAHAVRLAKLIRRTSSEIRRLRTSVWEAELGDFDVVIYDRLEPATTTADLVASPALMDDGFFAKVVHPQWSTRRIVGLPWRFAGQKRFHLTALAQLGRRGGNNGTV